MRLYKMKAFYIIEWSEEKLVKGGNSRIIVFRYTFFHYIMRNHNFYAKARSKGKLFLERLLIF